MPIGKSPLYFTADAEKLIIAVLISDCIYLNVSRLIANASIDALQTLNALWKVGISCRLASCYDFKAK